MNARSPLSGFVLDRLTRGLLIGAPLLLVGCQDDMSPAPVDHVVLIVVDTLRADHVGAYGHERPTTPNLDRLAEQGVRFEQAISQCSWTAPSMISLMASRYVASALIAIPDGVVTLPESMREGGYETAAFVTNSILEPEKGFARGFDHYEVLSPRFADAVVVAWLRDRANRRTFTYIHLSEPHTPYGSRPGPWIADPPPLPVERAAYYQDLEEELGFVAYGEGVEHVRRSIAGYDDDVLGDDARIGRYVQALQRSGQWENSAVLVASDHGEGLWTRPAYAGSERERTGSGRRLRRLEGFLKSGHGNQVYRELVHVPLLLVAPGLEPRTVPALVENVDIAPTLLELCHLPPPRGLQGRSLLRAIEDPSDWLDHKPVAFTSTRLVHSAFTADGWQLLVPSPLGVCRDGLQKELYSLAQDPEARHNVLADHPRIAAELEVALRERVGQSLMDAPVLEEGDASMAALQALGYLNGDVFDWVEQDVRERSTQELLEIISRYGNSCLVRLKAATELEQRRLSSSERSELEELLRREPSPAVRQALSQV